MKPRTADLIGRVNPVDHLWRFLADPQKAEGLTRWLHVSCAVAALAAAVLLVDSQLRFLPDEEDYARLAVNLAQNGIFSIDGVHPTAFRPPGFAWLLAAAALISPQIAFLKCVSLMLWLLAAWLTGRIARRLAGPFAEAAALFLVLCYPALLYGATTLYPQTMAWMLCAFLGWLAVQPKRGAGAIVVGGVASTLLILTVPNLLPVSLSYIAAILWSGDRARWGKSALVVAIIVAGVGLWTARNYQVLGAFVPLSTNSGMNLYMGNSPTAGANSGVASAAELDGDALSVLSEPARNQALMRRAIDWIVANPGDFVQLTALKFVNWFGFHNQLTSNSPIGAAQDAVMFVSFYTILGLALVRLVAMRVFPFRRWEAIFLVGYVLVAIGYALFFTRIRFRLPVDFVPILLGAVLLADLVRLRATTARAAAAT